MTITKALDTLRDRAVRERDAVAYATIGQVLLHLPTSAASAEVPDVSGQAPFRPSD